jgi:hypothetical protein
MLKKLAWILGMLVAAVTPLAQTRLMAAQTGPAFAAGQIWSIKSTSPTTAKVVIDRIEPWREKVAVHVSLIDVPIPQGAPRAGGTTVISHMPFEESALAASVDRLLGTGASPPSSFESGYKDWQNAAGGIFTISVEKAMEFTFQAITRWRT